MVPRIAALSLLSLILCLHCLAQPPGDGISDAMVERLERHLDHLERLGFAGVLVVTREDMPLLVHGSGLADRERAIPWSPGTVSTIGSITKQFTGAAILALAEGGALDTDDLLGEYFDTVPPDKQGITVHHLLTQSSGIVDLDGVGDFDRIGRDEFVRRILAQKLAFSPGERYEYSNANYSLLGAIIEQVTGKSYEIYLQERLFVPNGLFETGYVHAEWGQGRLAQGYRDGERWGTVLERPIGADGPYWVLRANGGIHSTAWDMVRWGQALLKGTVLSAPSMENYWSPHVDEGGGDSFYGYGWVVADAGGTRVITHNGGNGIFFADMAIVPDRELILFMMTNVVADFPPAGRLLVQIGSYLLGLEPLPTIPEFVPVGREVLEPWTGTYLVAVDGREEELEVALSERGDGAWELTVEPLGPAAFGALLSTRPYEPTRAQRFSARIDAIIGAMLQDDLEPLAEAYGGDPSAEFLAERWAERRRMMEKENGRLEGHQVLGTAMRAGYDLTLVRLEMADGWVDRAYVWAADAEEQLLGVSRRGLEDRLHVLPGPDGDFATWDLRSGGSRPVRFEVNENGVRRLIVGEDPQTTATAPPADDN